MGREAWPRQPMRRPRSRLGPPEGAPAPLPSPPEPRGPGAGAPVPTLHLAAVEARGAQEAVADGVEATPPGSAPDAASRAGRRRRPRRPRRAGAGRVQRRVQGGPPGGARGARGPGQGRGARAGGRRLLPGAPAPGAPRRQRLRLGSRGAPAPGLVSSSGLRGEGEDWTLRRRGEGVRVGLQCPGGSASPRRSRWRGLAPRHAGTCSPRWLS